MKPIITEEKLIDLLPHGSGIDCDWIITEHKNGNVTAKNYYHSMNEHGGYDGYMPFTVRIYKVKKTKLHKLKGPCARKWQILCMKGDIDVNLTCNDNRRKSFYGQGDSLGETIQHHLESILTPIRAYESISNEEAQKLIEKGAITDD